MLQSSDLLLDPQRINPFKLQRSDFFPSFLFLVTFQRIGTSLQFPHFCIGAAISFTFKNFC